MKKYLLSIVVSLFSVWVYGQSISGGFLKSSDTIKRSANKEINFKVRLVFDKDLNSQYKKLKVTINLLPDKSNLNPGNIYISQKEFVIKDLTKTDTIDIPVKIIADSLRDRIANLQLVVHKEDDTTIDINENYNKVEQLYILPFESSEKSSFEPFVFIGTNFDLLDGLQPKNLYAKMNFFWKLNKSNYLQFGIVKNRIFSSPDSIKNVTLADVFQTKKNLHDTTLSYVSGKYSKVVNTKIEPITLFFEYHYKLFPLDNTSSIFVSLGAEYGVFTTTVTNTRSNVITDTTVVKIDKDSKFVLNPYVSQYTTTRPNYLVYTGVMFIFDTDDLNIKTQILGGMNQFYQLDLHDDMVDVFTIRRAAYIQFKLNAIVKKGGFAASLDVLTRAKTNPVFGLTLSKVVDLKDLKSLFSSLSSTK